MNCRSTLADESGLLMGEGFPAALIPQLLPNTMILLIKLGAGEANRTPDPNLGKVMLYP